MQWVIGTGLVLVLVLLGIGWGYIILEMKDLARQDRLDRSKGINPNRKRR